MTLMCMLTSHSPALLRTTSNHFGEFFQVKDLPITLIHKNSTSCRWSSTSSYTTKIWEPRSYVNLLQVSEGRKERQNPPKKNTRIKKIHNPMIPKKKTIKYTKIPLFLGGWRVRRQCSKSNYMTSWMCRSVNRLVMIINHSSPQPASPSKHESEEGS